VSWLPAAQAAAEIDTGDTAWMLAATALVLLMTPALGLFYAGLVRAKNSLNTFMMCIAAIGIAGFTGGALGVLFAGGTLGAAFIDPEPGIAAFGGELGVVGFVDPVAGAEAFRRALEQIGVTDITFELFDGTHMGIEYRYPLSLKYLAERLSA